MAPPKGTIPQRLIAQDFLGVNWSKVGWRTPYQNFYPLTICGGQAGRQWSNPISFGHWSNRTTRHLVRGLALMAPTMYIGMMVFLMADWFQVMKVNYGFAGYGMGLGKPLDLPEWALTKRAEELSVMGWNKPGQMAKHHYGGAISIPGSERLVPEM